MIDTQLHQKFATLAKVSGTQNQLLTEFSHQLDRIEQMLTALCLQKGVSKPITPAAQGDSVDDSASDSRSPLTSSNAAPIGAPNSTRTMAPTVAAKPAAPKAQQPK